MSGLSPRVRGNQDDDPRVRGHVRSIPACAGEPHHPGKENLRAQVYPRVCGGTARVSFANAAPRGLSPRVRGNRGERSRRLHPARSIPACAGEPRWPGWGRRTGWVYPRVCGGTDIGFAKCPGVAGLSPRVRGNPRRPVQEVAERRSIPACAGEPFSAYSRSCRSRVYPRVCGGTRPASSSGARKIGLSPRVRGNRKRCRCRRPAPRSIPACAGEPKTRTASTSATRVYPRVCGGTCPRGCGQIRAGGLSPRVRGNPLHHIGVLRREGSIPACAGEPFGSTGPTHS